MKKVFIILLLLQSSVFSMWVQDETRAYYDLNVPARRAALINHIETIADVQARNTLIPQIQAQIINQEYNPFGTLCNVEGCWPVPAM